MATLTYVFSLLFSHYQGADGAIKNLNGLCHATQPVSTQNISPRNCILNSLNHHVLFVLKVALIVSLGSE